MPQVRRNRILCDVIRFLEYLLRAYLCARLCASRSGERHNSMMAPLAHLLNSVYLLKMLIIVYLYWLFIFVIVIHWLAYFFFFLIH